MADQLRSVDQFFQTINAAMTQEKVFASLEAEIDRLGFEFFAYELMWPDKGVYKPLYHSNYPSDWLKYYIEKRYCRDDIICRQTSQKNQSFLWSEIVSNRFVTEQQLKIFKEGQEAGVQSGATIPIHGPGKAKAYLVVANNIKQPEFEKLFSSRRHILHLITTYTHERILLLQESAADVQTKNSLTPREIEVLTLSALGKDRGDIAHILRLEESTVTFHLKNAFKKLEVYNKTHAVAKAMTRGLIAL